MAAPDWTGVILPGIFGVLDVGAMPRRPRQTRSEWRSGHRGVYVIPDFDSHGVLPPIRPGEAGHVYERAPYRTDILTFCQRFGTTAERCAILSGLLALRESLTNAGLDVGFQWLDGSFTENIEKTDGRPPNDVDVVTFAPLGDKSAQRALHTAHPDVFQPDCKKVFRVDHYFYPTDKALDVNRVRRIAYWYSMWAHRRDNRWKGFVEVSLTSNDEDARGWLARAHTAAPGGAP